MSASRVRLGSGRFKGRELRVPRGARPTSARVRGALLDSWQFRLPGARILDLFAGSGAVGLEALGRGGVRLVALESDRRAVESLRLACEAMAGAAATVRRARLPADLARATAGERFDLVFADPPYGFEDLRGLVVAADEVLDEDGELVIEHSSRRAAPERAASLERVDQRRYGESVLSVYGRSKTAGRRSG